MDLQFLPKQKPPLSGLQLVSSHLRFGGLAASVHGKQLLSLLSPSNFPRPGRRAAHKAIATPGLSMLPKLHVDHVDPKVLIRVWWFRGLEVQKPWNVLLEETLRFEIQAFQCSFQYVGVRAIHNQRPLVLCVWFSSILSGDMFLRARSTNSSNN